MKKIVWLAVIVLSGCGGGSEPQPTTAPVTLTPVSTPAPVIVTPAVTTPPPAPCTLLKISGTYPSEYLGTFNIPSPTQKLDPSITRSVGFKDFYPRSDVRPANCTDTEYSRLMYMATLDRLQALGVDRVWVYTYGPFVDLTADKWVVDKNSLQIPESQLIWLMEEVKRRGIKLYLAWQYWFIDIKGNSLDISESHMYNMSEEEYIRIVESWRTIVVDLAKLGEAHGLAGIALDWNAFYVPAISMYRETTVAKFSSIADDIRKNFSGKITYGQTAIAFYDKRLFSKIDELHVSLAPRISPEENMNLSVDILRDKFLQEIQKAYYQIDENQQTNNSIPVIFELAIQSRDKYFVDGWVEDSFCVNNCIQKTYKTDFSVQAMGVEAAFQAITLQKFFKTTSVNFHSSYWHTDAVVPSNVTPDQSDFPNLSQSIRGKPAEEIVRKWYQR